MNTKLVHEVIPTMFICGASNLVFFFQEQNSENYAKETAITPTYSNPCNRFLASLKILNHFFAHIYQL